MKHLRECLCSYNKIKQLIVNGKLEEAYREIAALPQRYRSFKIITLNLYALMSMVQDQPHKAL
jgi:hypothetical protein